MRHQPVSAAIHMVTAGQPFPYHLPDVPGGTWFVHVVGVADSTDPEPWTRRTALIATHGPVRVTAGVTTYVSLVLRPQQPTDPPILLALPNLEVPPEGYARAQTPMDTAGDLASSRNR
jgi:AraC family transcriptional regulator